jgi:hypothetical protein
LKIRINSKRRREPEGFHGHFGKLLGTLPSIFRAAKF